MLNQLWRYSGLESKSTHYYVDEAKAERVEGNYISLLVFSTSREKKFHRFLTKCVFLLQWLKHDLPNVILHSAEKITVREINSMGICPILLVWPALKVSALLKLNRCSTKTNLSKTQIAHKYEITKGTNNTM